MRKIVLLFALILSPEVSLAEIPEELREIEDKMVFLVSIANRCNAQLELSGKSGINSEDCVEFQSKQIKVFEELLSKGNLFREAAQEIDRSSSLERKLEWEFFFKRLESATEKVNKVQDHINFLSE